MSRSRLLRLMALFVLLGTGLAGCRRADESRWPTLLPRPGEVSPLVPRTPMGACAGCGQDVFTASPASSPPAPVPVPGDAVARLDATEKAIRVIEAKLPDIRRALDRAVLAANAAPGDSDLATNAEIERSRLALLRVPLLQQGATLDALEDALVGADGAAPLRDRLAALRARLVQLRASPSGEPDALP
jgi:hypothetical protein